MFMITDCALGRNDDDQHEQSNHVETIDAKGMHMQLSRPPASATATDEEVSKHTNKQTAVQSQCEGHYTFSGDGTHDYLEY